MFSISYIEKSSELPNGQIHAKIFDEASWIYKKDEFPFLVIVFFPKVQEDDKTLRH